jgi:hypothetical protein
VKDSRGNNVGSTIDNPITNRTGDEPISLSELRCL